MVAWARGRESGGTRLSQEDRHLVASLRRGDASAIAAIDARYGRIISGFLREALGDRGSAEDVHQQVLVEVWRRGNAYDPDRASPLTWILMIARSRAIDERRRRRPEPAEPEAEVAEADERIDGLLEQWRVAGLLARLPREEALLLRMRFYDDLSQTDIAARTGIPLGTVKGRMSAGLNRLREMIGEEER